MKDTSLACLFLLVASVPTTGQDVRSYSAQGSDSDCGLLLIDSVPLNFVLTDVFVSSPTIANADGTVFIQHCTPGEPSPVVDVVFGHYEAVGAGTAEFHFNSGIRPTPGSPLYIGYTGNSYPDVLATAAGYIADPTQGGTVPAVSTWGLAALALLLLTGGSFIVLANRSQPVS